MAQNTAAQTSEFAGFLKPDLAEDYFKEAARSSVVQSLTRRIPLGINGTGDSLRHLEADCFVGV